MKKVVLLILAATLGLAFSPSFAATCPSAAGSSSTCSINVEVQVGQLMQITGVQDLSLPNWNGSPISYGSGGIQTQNLCIFSNEVSSQYNITFSDTTGAANLSLKGQAQGMTIPFTLLLTDYSGASHTVSSNNQQITNLPGSITPNCQAEGGHNATLQVAINGAGNATADMYTDTISISVSPPV